MKRSETAAGNPGSRFVQHPFALGASRALADEQVARLKQRDPLAWEELFQEHHARVYRYVLRRTGDRAAAEDLAAETFVRALRAIDRYQPRGAPIGAWLYRIAHDATVDHQRRQRLRKTLPLEAADAVEAELPVGVVASAHLQQALRGLPPEQQQVLILRFIEGLSPDEAAQVMGKRPGTVRVLQHRALKRLREILAGEKGGPR